MANFIARIWNRFTNAVESATNGKQTLSKVMNTADEDDRKEIEQANSVIVNHQYIKHMAEARIAARANWRTLQEAARGNVTPLLAAETARMKTH